VKLSAVWSVGFYGFWTITHERMFMSFANKCVSIVVTFIESVVVFSWKLTREEIYRELAMLGHQYTGPFQAIQQTDNYGLLPEPYIYIIVYFII